MKKRELKLVITFHTTADAMEMEQLCMRRQMPGRLIPVPSTISAGCGLAWCAPLEWREPLAVLTGQSGIKEEAVYECLL